VGAPPLPDAAATRRAARGSLVDKLPAAIATPAPLARWLSSVILIVSYGMFVSVLQC
jgi:hypothetical protein